MSGAAPGRISVFCEDRGHELFLRALIRRLAAEAAVDVELEFRNSSGGLGHAVSNFKLYQQLMKRGRIVGTPDVLLVVVDGNDLGWQARRHELTRIIDSTVFPVFVVGCPDPYVERWCLLEPQALEAVGAVPPSGKAVYRTGRRAVFKKQLKEALADGGVIVLTDEMEVAPEIVAVMNLKAGAIRDPSLKALVGDLRAALRALRAPRS